MYAVKLTFHVITFLLRLTRETNGSECSSSWQWLVPLSFPSVISNVEAAFSALMRWHGESWDQHGLPSIAVEVGQR